VIELWKKNETQSKRAHALAEGVRKKSEVMEVMKVMK
jgi:hypothetical protein